MSNIYFSYGKTEHQDPSEWGLNISRLGEIALVCLGIYIFIIGEKTKETS